MAGRVALGPECLDELDRAGLKNVEPARDNESRRNRKTVVRVDVQIDQTQRESVVSGDPTRTL